MTGQQTNGSVPFRLLMVDDDDADRLLARRALRSMSIEFSEASSLKAARELLARGGVDCAVVGLGMPGGSGMELISGQGPPMIVLTGMYAESTAREALDRGALACLPKDQNGWRIMHSLVHELARTLHERHSFPRRMDRYLAHAMVVAAGIGWALAALFGFLGGR